MLLVDMPPVPKSGRANCSRSQLWPSQAFEGRSTRQLVPSTVALSEPWSSTSSSTATRSRTLWSAAGGSPQTREGGRAARCCLCCRHGGACNGPCRCVGQMQVRHPDVWEADFEEADARRGGEEDFLLVTSIVEPRRFVPLKTRIDRRSSPVLTGIRDLAALTISRPPARTALAPSRPATFAPRSRNARSSSGPPEKVNMAAISGASPRAPGQYAHAQKPAPPQPGYSAPGSSDAASWRHC